jgi:uncharacterized membrane protein
MRNHARILLLICWITAVASCTTEPNLENVPEISFSTQVQPILSSHCNFSGCHGASPEGPGSFQTYEQVMGSIKAGNANGSALYKSITRGGLGVEFMPPSGYQDVSPENIKLIYWWIEQGAKNN